MAGAWSWQLRPSIFQKTTDTKNKKNKIIFKLKKKKRIKKSQLTTPEPICCKRLDPVPAEELPVMKDGGHMEGLR